jgi:hypothetical protein
MEEQTQLDAMLVRLAKLKVFAFDGALPSPIKHVRHHIDVGAAPPARARLRRYSLLELETLWREVDRLLRLGAIEPANSPWNSPLLLVPKPDGRLRVVQDLRAVNKAVLEYGDGQEGYPLPRVDELLETLHHTVYFTSCDAQDGFWQVQLDKESRHITAFQTRWGQYQWRVGTMGLARMPATFQRMMELAVGHDALWAYALVYIDDLLIFSPTFEKHLKQVERVLVRLATAGVKLKPTKCKFAQLKLKFLGHIISGEGRRVDPAKVVAVQQISLPQSLGEVRSFLQMCSYYREYIPHFSTMTEPLNALLRKEAKFAVTDDVCAAWATLKDALSKAPLLSHPDYDGIRAGTMELVLQTDASDVGLGAVLSQRRVGSTKEEPLAYFSRLLKGAERNYATYDREALAVVEAVLHFRPLLHNGHPFQLETDHAALKYLLNPTSEIKTKRQERYISVLQEFPMQIVYRAGHLNGNADACSRLFNGEWEDLQGSDPAPPQPAGGVELHSLHAVCCTCPRHAPGGPEDGGEDLLAALGELVPDVLKPAGPNRDAVATAQRADEFCSQMLDYLQHETMPAGAPEARKKELRSAKFAGYYAYDGRLYCAARRNRPLPEEDRLVLPRSLVEQVLRGAHDDPVGGGHVGFDRTYHKVAQHYFWPGIYSDVAEWVQRCPTCLQRKLQQPTGVPVLGYGKEGISMPFEFVGVDVVGPFPTSEKGNQYIVVFTDYLTRWVEAFAVPKHDAVAVADLLVNEVIARHGVPRVLLSDNGPEFRGKLVQRLCERINVGKRFTSPYHPQANGLTERANGAIVALLSMIADTDQQHWDEWLPKILLAHRASINTTMGASPFRLLYGREPVLPFEHLLRAKQLPHRWHKHAEYLEQLEEQLREGHRMVEEFLTEQQRVREREAAANTRRQYLAGERVWVHRFLVKKGDSPKLQGRRWFGPYVVVKRLEGADTYEVRPDATAPEFTGPPLKIPWVHAVRMRPYEPRDEAAVLRREKASSSSEASAREAPAAARRKQAAAAAARRRRRAAVTPEQGESDSTDGAPPARPATGLVARGGQGWYTLPDGMIALAARPATQVIQCLRGQTILQVWDYEGQYTRWCEGIIEAPPKVRRYDASFYIRWRSSSGKLGDRGYYRLGTYSTEPAASCTSWFVYGTMEKLERLMPREVAAALRDRVPAQPVAGTAIDSSLASIRGHSTLLPGQMGYLRRVHELPEGWCDAGSLPAQAPTPACVLQVSPSGEMCMVVVPRRPAYATQLLFAQAVLRRYLRWHFLPSREAWSHNRDVRADLVRELTECMMPDDMLPPPSSPVVTIGWLPVTSVTLLRQAVAEEDL